MNELFLNFYVTLLTSQFILQPFRRFTYVTAVVKCTLFHGQNWSFQQDSSPAHKARTTQQLQETNVRNFISTSDWPSVSIYVYFRFYGASTSQAIGARDEWWWMMMDDNDGQMIFGFLRGLKLPDICLTGEKNPTTSVYTYSDLSVEWMLNFR